MTSRTRIHAVARIKTFVAVVLIFTAHRLVAQERRLESRALFAALDSISISDSAAILPMHRDERLDSLMINMVAYLDAHQGSAYGLASTPIRHWNGFGTQAHPDLGILIDSLEIVELVRKVRRGKSESGVPSEEIERRLEYVVRFLIAHEYAHLMQYRVFGRSAVMELNATRVIECAADLLGGFSFREFLDSRFADGPSLRIAERTAVDFGYFVGASDWLDGTTHPLGADRRRCIARGIDVAAALSHMQAGSADSAYENAAAWLKANEPDLPAEASQLVAWASSRARAMLSQSEVVDSNAVLEVIRDSSVAVALRKVATAAAEGGSALRPFRGAPAPGGGTFPPRPLFLLRQSLPLPWKCTIEGAEEPEEVLCTWDEVGTGEEAFQGLLLSVQTALLHTPWRPAKFETDSAERRRGGGAVEEGALFVLDSARVRSPHGARVEVVYVYHPLPPPIQMAGNFTFTVLIRPRQDR